MIGVKLMGGLGNQMFQYALGRKMSLKYNSKFILDLNSYNNQVEIDTPRHFELGCFNINASLLTEPSLDKKPLLPLFSKIPYFSNIYSEKQFKFSEEVLLQPDGTLYQGYWQTEKYFSDIRSELLIDFSLKDNLPVDDLKILSNIQQKNSVSLHVRRGDYVSNVHANKFHGLKGTDYYTEAISILEKSIGDFTLFVFSDDIEWCKTNLLNIYKDIVFVDGQRDGCFDMFLMKNCKHNIVANSSFSWWAAWLNENPNKQVIAPKNWFDDPNTDTSDVVPAEWTKI